MITDRTGCIPKRVIEAMKKSGFYSRTICKENRSLKVDCLPCLEVVELICRHDVGVRTGLGGPITPALRDVHAVNRYGLLSLYLNGETYGRNLFGVDEK